MTSPAAAVSRMLVLDEGKPYELFEVLELVGDIARVRSPFLFEVGEQLAVRIERDGAVFEATARIRAHVGTAESRITELELADQTTPRRVVSG